MSCLTIESGWGMMRVFPNDAMEGEVDVDVDENVDASDAPSRSMDGGLASRAECNARCSRGGMRSVGLCGWGYRRGRGFCEPVRMSREGRESALDIDPILRGVVTVDCIERYLYDLRGRIGDGGRRRLWCPSLTGSTKRD